MVILLPKCFKAYYLLTYSWKSLYPMTQFWHLCVLLLLTCPAPGLCLICDMSLILCSVVASQIRAVFWGSGKRDLGVIQHAEKSNVGRERGFPEPHSESVIRTQVSPFLSQPNHHPRLGIWSVTTPTIMQNLKCPSQTYLYPVDHGESTEIV